MEVTTTDDLRIMPYADVVLIQHDWALYDTGSLYSFCENCDKPIIMFSHCRGTQLFDGIVDGYIVMCDGLLPRVQSPVHISRHPGWVPTRMTNREKARKRFGLNPNAVIIGSSGFIHPNKQFAEIADCLMQAETTLRRDREIAQSWLIEIISARHWEHEDDGPSVIAERALADLSGKRLHYRTDFLPPNEMNARLQACDLLWSWTKAPSTTGASGVASDQYGSGVRLVVPRKQQMSHLFDLPNVVVAPSDLEGFVDTLIEEAQAIEFPRHDPSLLSWQKTITSLADFITLVWREAKGDHSREAGSAKK
jgi:hypothetical protein